MGKFELNYLDSALFIAYTTLPIDKNSKEFYGKNIAPNFSKFKKDIGLKDDNILYKPIPYYLFGEFDLAVLSFIDDFSFATTIFKPQDTTFKYQINTGIIPYDSTIKKDIIDNQFTTLYDKIKALPLIGITTLKLNNAFIVGNGKAFTNIVYTFLLDVIKKKIEINGKKDDNFHFLITESIGWNEFALFCASNSFEKIKNVVDEIRNITWKNIKEYNKNSLDEIEKNSLFNLWEIPDLDNCHPIIATNTQFGFQMDNFNVDKIEDKNKKYFQLNWNTKSGHDTDFLNLLNKNFPNDKNYNYTFGKSTIIYPPRLITFEEYIEKIIKPIQKEEDFRQNLKQNIYKLESVFIHEENTIVKNNPTDYKTINYELVKLIIPVVDIKNIENKLREINISKTLKEQVINMFHNFNEVIADQLIFNNFIDLRESLIYFQNELLGFSESNKFDILSENYFPDEELDVLKKELIEPEFASQDKNYKKTTVYYTNFIHEFLDNWDVAYWNRYFHSYYFSEVNDFSLEHHGGIEMIISAYDTMYKTICKQIYSKDPYQFVRVTTHTGITSNGFSNRLNYNHLFIPAIYASTVIHEAANQFIFELSGEKLEGDNNKRIFNSFKNSFKNGIVDSNNAYFKLLDDLPTTLFINSNIEKNLYEDFLGANLIRYLFVDYLTYRMGYQYPNEVSSEEISKLYINAHFAIIAQQSEYYTTENKYWQFDDLHFQKSYLRWFLMLKLFDLPDPEIKNAPFSCYQHCWANYTKPLNENIDTIVNHLKKQKLIVDIITEAKTKADKIVDGINKNSSLEKILNLNKELIKQYKLWLDPEDVNPNNKNVILRLNNNYKENNNDKFTNIEKNCKDNYNKLCIDPKGGFYVKEVDLRRKILLKNINYIKELWHIAQVERKNSYIIK